MIKKKTDREIILFHLRVGVVKYHNLLFQQPSILYTSHIRKCLSTADTWSYIHSVQLIVVILQTQTARLRWRSLV